MGPQVDLRIGSLRGKLPTVLFGIAATLIVFAPSVFDGLEPRHVAVALCAALFIAWIYNHRRYRAIADTPRSKIASAAQGYTEVCGIGQALSGTPLLAPITYLPCLWYRLKVETKNSDGQWSQDLDETSDTSFLLNDGTGECFVDPEHAKVIVAKAEVFRETDRRSTLWLLIPGTRIYVLGHFVTRSASADRPTISAELRDKLAEWKQTGHARTFDLNGDGEVDQDEWQLARAAARREVERERREADQQPDLHLIGPSPDGRAFIISDMDSERLQRRYRMQAWGSLFLFFAVLSGLAWHLAT